MFLPTFCISGRTVNRLPSVFSYISIFYISVFCDQEYLDYFLAFFNYIYFRQTLSVDGCISSRNTNLARSSWIVIVEFWYHRIDLRSKYTSKFYREGRRGILIRTPRFIFAESFHLCASLQISAWAGMKLQLASTFAKKSAAHHLYSDSTIRLACLGMHIPWTLPKVPQLDSFVVLLT